MLINDELYFQTFCTLLKAVVKAGGLEVSVENLQKKHFFFLSRKIKGMSDNQIGIKPATFRDYRYIYLKERRFSVRQNRLDLMAGFVGYKGWNDFRNTHFTGGLRRELKDQAIRLLILPDKRYGAVEKFEGQISELICHRYEELKEDLKIENLEIIYIDPMKVIPSGIDRIKEIGIKHDADLVIWPEYIHGQVPTMRVPLLLAVPDEQAFVCKKSRFKKIKELAEVHDGAPLAGVDVALFSLLGISAFEKGESIRAIDFLERVLIMEPSHPEALYHLGLLYQQQEQFGKSASYFEKLQELDPTENALVEKAAINLAQLFHTESAGLEKKKKTALSNQQLTINELQDDKPRIERKASLKINPWDEFPAARKGSLANCLLILKGDNRVLMTKNLEPLLRNTFIHEDEPITFLTTHTDLALLSVKNQGLFYVRASQKELPIKEALINFDQWQQLEREAAKDQNNSAHLLLMDIGSQQMTKAYLPNDQMQILIFGRSGSRVEFDQSSLAITPTQA